MDGTVYAFTALKIRNAGVTELSDGIKEYEHLRKIDLGMNLFKNVSALLSLRFVTHLDLSRNLLQNL
jgi:Leucine-rich repeat (LRR) protein